MFMVRISGGYYKPYENRMYKTNHSLLNNSVLWQYDPRDCCSHK